MARPISRPGPGLSSLYVSDSARTRREVPGWQPAALTALACTAAFIASAGDLRSPHVSARMLCTAGTTVFIIAATTAVLRSAAWLRTRAAARIGQTHASVLHITAVVTGAATTVLTTMSLLAVPVGQLLLGGALTGALLGIAGQQTLANLIAGVVLLLTRTVAIGDRIRLHSGTLGGTFEGTVTGIGLTHVHLRTTDAPLSIPNTQMLAAAIAVLDPQAALPATPLRPKLRSIRRRRRPMREPATVRTTRLMPAVHPSRPDSTASARSPGRMP
ncbi:mechanosensitive ion channel family protein [Micromonospora chalcea]|uniref:mechanosensitive ion channel family protein n=1 Tax=Micromonospora chalcea TaxID=1874 RepID=UPI001075C0D6